MPRPNIDIKNLPHPKLILLGSVLCTVYFSVVALLHYFGKGYILTGVIVELATIPIILLTVVLFLFTCYTLFYKKEKPTYPWMVGLVLQVFCLLFLFV